MALKRVRCKLASRSGEWTFAEPKVDFGIERAAIWASGTRLCVLAALTSNLQQLSRSIGQRAASDKSLAVNSKARLLPSVAFIEPGMQESFPKLSKFQRDRTSRLFKVAPDGHLRIGGLRVQQATESGSAGMAIDGCCVSIGCVAIVLSTVGKGQEVNLLELALLGARGTARVSGGLLLFHAEATFLADVYSNVKRGWEPVAERWPFAIQAEHATTG